MLPAMSHILSLPTRNIIDILVVAFLVYQALMVVRGTRAGHVLLGISIMVLLYVASVWGRLEALRSVLLSSCRYLRPGHHRSVPIGDPPHAGAAGAQALVRVRRGLPRAGIGQRNPAGGGAAGAQKTGALIVLERDIGLRTFIESGVRLDARISRDLLLSIFQPGLPLHDGAVIVQKDRIAAAACFLPLTTNPPLSSQLGTRHRAAIGITEETDCLSLVVSEETGRISVASFGELVSGADHARGDRAH